MTSRSILKYNARDQLIARDDDVANVHVTQTYDDNGNLVTQTNNGVLRTYTYDARDRMVSLKEGTNEPLTFDYDANGLRLEKTQGSQSTKYQYDQGSLLAETNTIGNTLARYHYSATQLISETKAGTTPTQRHYLLDALRSPIALLTQQGAVSARTRYDAWGEVVAQQGTDGQLVAPARDTATASLPKSDGQPIGFTGYIKDSESGLYYAKARYYDPAIARFTTEDPEAGKDMEPPSLHRYLYAYANPTAYFDPTGRQSIDSARRAYEQMYFMASKPRDREMTKRWLDEYDVALRARANPEFTAAADWIGENAASLAKFSATMVLAQAETDMREENGPATVDLRAGLDATFKAAKEDPASLIFEGIRQRGEAVDEAKRAGDDFSARKFRTMQILDAGSSLAGAFGMLRYGARTLSKKISRFTPSNSLTIVEGTKGDSFAGSGGDIDYISHHPSARMASQELKMSCGPACGRQLLLDQGVDAPESAIRNLSRFSSRSGVEAESLADALTELDPRRNYRGGSVDPDVFDTLNANGPWIARVKPSSGIPHFVIVDGAENGNVRIRDPFGPDAPGPGQGIEGSIDMEKFMEYWRRGVNKVVFPAGDKGGK